MSKKRRMKAEERRTNSTSPVEAEGRETNSTSPVEAKGRRTSSSTPVKAEGRGTSSATPVEAEGRGTNSATPVEAEGRGTSSATPVEVEELYTVGEWAGMKQWKCALCPWDTLEREEAMLEHLASAHAPPKPKILVADKRGRVVG